MNKILQANLHRIHAERSTGVGAGALVYAQDTGRVLLCLRSDRCDDPNTWCCPGGGVEKGETIHQGLRREFVEEIGFSGEMKLIHYHTSESPDFVYHNHIGVVENEFEPVLNDEHTKWVWCHPNKMPQPLHPKFAESMRSPTFLTRMREVCPVL